jgi:hypothetical protein
MAVSPFGRCNAASKASTGTPATGHDAVMSGVIGLGNPRVLMGFPAPC